MTDDGGDEYPAVAVRRHNPKTPRPLNGAASLNDSSIDAGFFELLNYSG